jgi:hypothetical protein
VALRANEQQQALHDQGQEVFVSQTSAEFLQELQDHQADLRYQRFHLTVKQEEPQLIGELGLMEYG